MNEATQSLITDWITAISAIFTAVAAVGSAILLYFYTKYTHSMQQSIAQQVNEQNNQTKELIHQRRLGIMPYLIIEINSSQLFVTNIGNGMALNVEIKSFKIMNYRTRISRKSQKVCRKKLLEFRQQVLSVTTF